MDTKRQIYRNKNVIAHAQTHPETRSGNTVRVFGLLDALKVFFLLLKMPLFDAKILPDNLVSAM